MGRQRTGAAIALHAALIPLALVWIAPLWMMFTYSTLPESEFYRATVPLLPSTSFLDNWDVLDAQTKGNFIRALFNSAATSAIFTVLSLGLTSLAGYAFARFRFFGRNALFTLVIATLTIPAFVVIIPQFILIARDLKLSNTWVAVIVPPLFSSVGVFFMRQNFMTVPQDMLDAARVDGAGEFQIFRQIALPLVVPALAALAIILFLFSWNAFLWPLLVLSKPEIQTAPVALGALVGLNRVFWNAIMVAAVLMTLPMLALFLFLQRYFIAGITAGAVK
ncbi:MAG TPA: carbohydrate ABC transporter permease [Bauldia sp.]|nr:carbohydrate ABC transporter permease [Bauldia sp.]